MLGGFRDKLSGTSPDTPDRVEVSVLVVDWPEVVAFNALSMIAVSVPANFDIVSWKVSVLCSDWTVHGMSTTVMEIRKEETVNLLNVWLTFGIFPFCYQVSHDFLGLGSVLHYSAAIKPAFAVKAKLLAYSAAFTWVCFECLVK